jgi:hypothetical protein
MPASRCRCADNVQRWFRRRREISMAMSALLREARESGRDFLDGPAEGQYLAYDRELDKIAVRLKPFQEQREEMARHG